MYYCKRGVLADKPFTVLLAENGAATHEEMVTSSGFDGPSSLLYRLRAATEVDRIELVQDRPLVAAPGTLRNHQVRVEHIGATGAFWEAREPLFYNADLVYSVARPAPGDTTFYRNAHCDELLIVVNGTGRVDSAFGSLSYEPLDMLYVPRGTTIQVDADTDRQLLVVLETRSPLGPPPRAMGARGQMRYNAMYQERDIRLPEYLGARDDEAAHEVYVRAGGQVLRHTKPSHPFDAIGWDGTLYPFALSMRSLAPMVGRLHPTPDLYQIFESRGVYVSAITPMRLPDHEHLTPAQPDHSSDCDEIFHRFGTANEEHGFKDGVATLHGRTSAHGAAPQLKARPRRASTSGWGVLIDIGQPGNFAVAAVAGDVDGYHGRSADDASA